jgi:hypothetical protein
VLHVTLVRVVSELNNIVNCSGREICSDARRIRAELMCSGATGLRAPAVVIDRKWRALTEEGRANNETTTTPILRDRLCAPPARAQNLISDRRVFKAPVLVRGSEHAQYDIAPTGERRRLTQSAEAIASATRS